MSEPKLEPGAEPKSTLTAVARWRLLLGRYAEERLGALDGQDAARDEALEYLYGREYRGRGGRELASKGKPGPGSLDPSQLTVVDWLGKARELFPGDTMEVIEAHALERYQLTELVTDRETLSRLEPNHALLRVLLSLRSRLSPEVLEVARGIVRKVVDELRRRLEPEVRRSFSGRASSLRHAPFAIHRNFDVKGTIKRNLRHFDRERGQLAIDRALFFARNARQLPWDVILCIDQSGSMADAVIHAAVLAGILCGLPVLRVRMVVFDTAVVDLSAFVDDPVEVLMRTQLGGGTDIAKALRYCSQLIENPHRSALILISDFCEGGSVHELRRAVAALAADHVRLLGLPALDDAAAPMFDRDTANMLAELGMTIAALTPARLADWLAQVIA